MAVTRLRLDELLGRRTGFFLDSTSTGAGAGGGTTTIDSTITKYDASLLGNKWIMAVDGDNAGASRRISGVVTSTITHTAFANQMASGVNYRIFAYDPDLFHYAIEEACRKSYPDLYVPLTEYLVVDGLLANPSFEITESTGAITVFASYDSTVEGTTLVTDAGHGLSTGDVITISGTTNYNGVFEIVRVSSSTFYIRAPFIADDGTGTWVEALFNQEGTASGWTATSGTWTFPTTLRRVHGTRAASCTAAGSLTQNLYTMVNIKGMAGKTLHVRAWAFAPAASTARIRVSQDGGSTFSNGSFHGGADEWEDLELDVAITEDATSLTVYLAAGSGDYFDLVRAWIDGVARYPLSQPFVNGRGNVVEQQVYLDRPNGPYSRLDYSRPPRSGHLLRLEGKGYLSIVDGDNESVEINERQAELLVARAAEALFGMLKHTAPSNRAQHEADEMDARADAERLRRRPGATAPRMGANEQTGWSTLEENGLPYLLLDGRR